MSNRYFFDGTDINEIFDSTLGSSDTYINNHFGNLPVKVFTVLNLTSTPTNFSSSDNTPFNTSIHKIRILLMILMKK